MPTVYVDHRRILRTVIAAVEHSWIGEDVRPDSDDGLALADNIRLERYRYILRQIESVNQNTHRFLALYQAIVTSLATACVALFLGYEQWGVKPGVARAGLIALMFLASLVACFAAVLIIAGIFSWLDYRREECRLVNPVAGEGFRDPPQWRSFLRWYETWVALFIIASMAAMWLVVLHLLLPVLDAAQ
ncbi:hypothetical protein ACGFIE_07660 [Micromonospora sp. NPDC049275]|uniref:hypothetical protein n=1 Tax=Micromonospora sp. NPDC049275 TaxID=3364268 RepID=UPI00371A1116